MLTAGCLYSQMDIYVQSFEIYTFQFPGELLLLKSYSTDSFPKRTAGKMFTLITPIIKSFQHQIITRKD
jgi:hypothetical protein